MKQINEQLKQKKWELESKSEDICSNIKNIWRTFCAKGKLKKIFESPFLFPQIKKKKKEYRRWWIRRITS